MALSANTNYTARRTGSQRFKVAASEVIFKGAGVGLRVSDGLAYEWDSTSGDRFLGIAAQKVEADSSGNLVRTGVPTGFDTTTETPYVFVISNESILTNVTVAGVNAETNSMHPVWMTDDNTFTLTPQLEEQPVGYVIAVVSTSDGTADVAIFNWDQMGAAIQTDHGYQRQTVASASAGAINTSHTTGLFVTNLPLIGSGRIVKMLIIVGRKASGVTCAIKFKLKLNGTFLKNTAGTFLHTVTASNLKTAGYVQEVNIAHSTTYSAYFGPGDEVSVTAQCTTAPAEVGDVTVILESARTLNG